MENSRKTLTSVVVFVIVVILFIWGISTNNSLIEAQQNTKLQEAQIQAVLQERADKIPNLVNTAKGYADQEERIAKLIAEGRKFETAMETGDLEAASEISDNITVQIKNIQEDNPFESDKIFTALMDEIAGSENRIKQERRRYNEIATVYNKKVTMFPSSFISGLFGFEEIPLFKASEKAQDAPVVDFSDKTESSPESERK